MIIEKVMNNNCVQASMNGQEVIISGPGVGYNKKYGMSVPEHPANRIFYVRNYLFALNSPTKASTGETPLKVLSPAIFSTSVSTTISSDV